MLLLSSRALPYDTQVLKARQAEEQHGKGYWEDNAVVQVVRNDEALSLRLQHHHYNHRRSSHGIDGGRKCEVPTTTSSLLPATTTTPATDSSSALCKNDVTVVGPQPPVNACHPPIECLTKKPPINSNVCRKLRHQEDDDIQEEDEENGGDEEKEDGKATGEDDGTAEWAEACISPQEEVHVSSTVAADDIDAPVPPLLSAPKCGPDAVLARKNGTQKKGVKINSVASKKEFNDDRCGGRDSTNNSHRVSTNFEAPKCRTTVGIVDRASDDESWSSSDEGDRGEVFGRRSSNSSSRRSVSGEAIRVGDDDWAGTDPYGSDDEGFIVEARGRAPAAATKTTPPSSIRVPPPCRKQSTKAAVTVAAGRPMMQPEQVATPAKKRELGWNNKLNVVAGPDARLLLAAGKQKTRFLSPPLVKKVGRISESSISSIRNDNNANNTTNTKNNADNSNINYRHGRRTVEKRAVSDKTAVKRSSYPALPHIETGGVGATSSAPSHTKTRASLVCSKEKSIIGVDLAGVASSGGKEYYVGREGGGDREGRRYRWPRAKNSRDAHQERGSSSIGKPRDEESKVRDDDDEWVVREFRARVEAARLEEEQQRLPC